MTDLLRRLLAALVLFGTVSSCTSTVAVAEFGRYKRNFKAALQAGSLILDRVADAERELGRALLPALNPMNPTFNPTQPNYYLDTVEPPITASLRASSEIVSDCNATLSGLANGESAEALPSRIASIRTRAVSAASNLAAAGGMPGADITAIATEILNPLKALKPLAEFGFRIRNQATFRDELLARHETVDAPIGKLIDATPRMFRVVTEPIAEGHITLTGTGPFTNEERADLEAFQRHLAEWVLLLRGSRVALQAAVDAIREGACPRTVEGFVIAAEEIVMLAAQTRARLSAP